MFCRVCGKENADNQKFCVYCGNTLNGLNIRTGAADDKTATIRIRCRKKKNIVRRMLVPVIGMLAPYYKIYVYIDGREYVMNSKEEQHDFPVSPGEHRIFLWHKRINRNTSNKITRAAKIAGEVIQGTSVIYGNANTYIMGTAMRSLDEWDGSEEAAVMLEAGEICKISCKANYFNMIKPDNTL